MPIDETVDMLLGGRAGHGRRRRGDLHGGRYSAFREWKTYLATDGSDTEQVITHVGAGLEANAADGDELQRRSFPEAGGHRAAGYEYIRALDLVGRATGLAEEAVALLARPRAATRPPHPRAATRPSCTCRSTSSCGHPTELDRVFGTEAAYAGTSFLTTDKLEPGFRYGSPLVTIVADATTPGGLGTFGWDDEGVAAQRVPLVSEGIFVGYLSEPRDRLRIGRSSGRRRAGRWLEPAAAHPDDEHQPRAATGHEPRGHHRRHG